MPINYRNLHVLVVGDRSSTRLLTREVLQSLGSAKENVVEAEDGRMGLQLLTEREIDLVICDWETQPMDGLAFVRALRDPAISKNPYVPIIFCSAFTERALIERARDSGVTEILTKPITVKAASAKIEEIYRKPREFVKMKQYFGPDRRRRSSAGLATGERRRGETQRR
jgi:two-component system, chemotaxis family, chemotaxis protein CheY